MENNQFDPLAELLGVTGEPFSLGSDTPSISPTLPETVHESELAALLGISRARITQLIRDGILKRSGRARFNLHEAVQAYTGQLRSVASRVGYAGGKGTPANAALNEEKLRLAKQQADKIELQNAAARGELVKALDVERAWAGVLRDVRAALLGVPSRCGATLPHLTAHDVQEIDREIRGALEGLANGN